MLNKEQCGNVEVRKNKSPEKRNVRNEESDRKGNQCERKIVKREMNTNYNDDNGNWIVNNAEEKGLKTKYSEAK